jgi:hypothetical protein
MANLILNGSTSGSVTLSSPAVSGTTTLTLPANTGTVVVTSGAQTIEFADGSASTPSITNSGDTNTGMFFPEADTIAFAEGGAESMRIDSSGNVLVGGTTSVTARLQAFSPNTSTGAISAISQNSSDVGQEVLSCRKFDNNTTTSQCFVRFVINNGSTGSGQINANGASQAAFGSFSDIRLKENIVDLPSQLDNVIALRPVEFDYIESEGGGHQTGFIAQEIQAIYPDSVGERQDGMLTVTGWNKTEAILVKAIQEQQIIIETIKSDIAELKAKVNV